MEETLRYFYSAVFQGIAAIISLGSMFFIYYFDKIENQKKVIRNNLGERFISLSPEGKVILNKKGIIEFTKQHIENNKNDKNNVLFEIKIKEYRQLEEKEKIKDHIPSFLKLAITILVLSLISLFLIGYSIYLNYLLIFVCIITIIITIMYLKQLLNMIFTILDLRN